MSDSTKDDTTSKITADEAATKIQATYRGFHTRRHLKQKSDRSHPCLTRQTDSNTNQVDPHHAATKIQANYRGYRTRKELALHGAENRMERVNLCPETTENRIHSSYCGFTTRQRSGKGLSDISNQDKHPSDEELNRAATKIQATFRGYQVRNQLTHRHEAECSAECSDDLILPDDASPQQLEAATRIQAFYRGYRVRKNFRSQTSPLPLPSHEYNSPDGKFDFAATKIQANFRGYRVRKEFQGHRPTSNHPPSPISHS